MRVARVLDWDGTITHTKRTLLEQLMRDFYRESGILKKIDMAFRYCAVKAYKILASSIGRIFGDGLITGETTSMQVFDVLMLRKVSMPLSFVEEHAKEYAKKIKPEHVAAMQKCKDDLYIVSAEPVQLLEAIIESAGLKQQIKKVYGTKFKVNNGIVTGFDRSVLFAGFRGKYLGMHDILKNGHYSVVHAIGDSMADIGLFEECKSDEYKDVLVKPYTFRNAPHELVRYVVDNGGSVAKDLDEFFD
jgi:phosphoserine phosphatase